MTKDKRNAFLHNKPGPAFSSSYTALPIDTIKPKGMLVKMHRFELILRQTSLQFGKSEEDQIESYHHQPFQDMMLMMKKKILSLDSYRCDTLRIAQFPFQ